jgi:hypothetical protein
MAYGIEGLEYGEMRVCAVCGEIYGEFSERGTPLESDETEETELYYQECYCRCRAGGASAHYTQRMKIRLNLDFAEIATLCYCCGREIIPSGSKFSSFFCGYCGGLIRRCADVDRHLLWIPLARHTLMNRINGVLLRGRDIEDKQKILEFATAANGYFSRIEELGRWKKLVILRNLEEAGFPSGVDIALPAYLTAVSRERFSRHRAFLTLAELFHEKYGEAPPPQERSTDESLPIPDEDEEQAEEGEETDEPEDGEGEDGEAEGEHAQDEPTGEDRTLYTPDKEIECEFYTLAIRNEALEQKYPGGLKGYLRKNGGYYNVDITTHGYMDLEDCAEYDDLVKNGLVNGKDFTFFGDDGVGKDYMPFHLGVDWLRGYCLNRHIMIFKVLALG